MVSKIGETNKIKELFRAIGNAHKSVNAAKIIDMGFKGAWERAW